MENPCLECPVDQNCCRNLHGLTVSESEYDNLFKGSEDKLEVFKKGFLFEIWSKDGNACPHWDGQCTKYGSRPMDCDLYPYTIGNVFDDGDTVRVSYHNRTECPLGAELTPPREKAERLLRAFFEKNTPEGTRINIVYDEGAARALNLLKRVSRKVRRVSPKTKYNPEA